MNRSDALTVSAAAVLLLVAACTDKQAVGPTGTSMSIPDAPSSVKGPVVQSATGSGIFISVDNLRTFSFTAQRHADGTVSGQWVRVNHASKGGLGRSEGQVTCFTISGNTVWLGGFAKSGLFSTPDSSRDVAWRVADNGQGSSAPPDQMSLQVVGAFSGFAADYCATTPGSPALLNIEAGNIQVRP